MKFRVFLINMKKSTDRYEFMSHQLKQLSLDFVVQEGIDYEKYKLENPDEKDVRDGITTELTSREKGISLSHKRILENIVKNDLDFSLILEDDVELPYNFKTIIENEIRKRKEKVTKWEYLSFNYPTVGMPFVRLWLFLFFNKLKKNKSISFYMQVPIYIIKFLSIVALSIFEKVREVIYRKAYTYGRVSLFYRPLYLAGCYLITKEGAKKLLSLNKNLTYTADRLPNVGRIKSGLKFYAFVPLLVKQRRDKFWDPITPEDKENFFNN